MMMHLIFIFYFIIEQWRTEFKEDNIMEIVDHDIVSFIFIKLCFNNWV